MEDEEQKKIIIDFNISEVDSILRSLELIRDSTITFLGNKDLLKLVEEKGGSKENLYELLYVVQSLIKKMKEAFDKIKM